MISIVVPVYRSEKTLKRCINSILMQTYREWEVLMVVDGPPDASGILADELAKGDARICVIHQENQGVSAARNTGIEAAKGEYLQFVDSDDYLEPDACEKLLSAIKEGDSQMVIAGFRHRYYGRDIKKLPEPEGTYELAESERIFLELYEAQFMNMPWNKLYQRKLIEKGFPSDLSLGEDLLFNLAYMRRVERFSILGEPVCNYVQEGSETTLSGRKREDKIEIAYHLYEETKQFCESVFPVEKKAEERESVLKGKVLTEFLDRMENLTLETFAVGRIANRRLRRKVLQEYREAWEELREGITPHLKLLDYKIIYYFFSRRQYRMTDFMIVLRSFVVKLLGKQKM